MDSDKNRLQEITMKGELPLPSYSTISVMKDDKILWESTVTVFGKKFKGEQKERKVAAEQSAAKKALSFKRKGSKKNEKKNEKDKNDDNDENEEIEIFIDVNSDVNPDVDSDANSDVSPKEKKRADFDRKILDDETIRRIKDPKIKKIVLIDIENSFVQDEELKGYQNVIFLAFFNHAHALIDKDLKILKSCIVKSCVKDAADHAISFTVGYITSIFEMENISKPIYIVSRDHFAQAIVDISPVCRHFTTIKQLLNIL